MKPYLMIQGDNGWIEVHACVGQTPLLIGYGVIAAILVVRHLRSKK